ncbi:MAG TPA: hypothetical protein VJJ26_00095 [Candidatus Babeliales bacterium]|nr:hypothetical protein [Candidatus Babeliales bacterium]
MLYTSKIRTFFFSLLLLPPLFTHAQEKEPQRCTINNTPVSSPVYNVEISPIITTTATATIHAIGVKIRDIMVLISQTAKEAVTKKNFDLLKDLIKQLIWQNRYKITGSTLVGSYSATSLLLIADYNQLDTMFWAHWKHQSTFEDLCAIPQKELTKELMLAIGQHHYNKTNPTDLAYPLVTFIKAIDWEVNTIKRYITTTKIIKHLHLIPIFPTNDNKINQATKMLARALFIKHIFLSWLADYNLTSTQKLNS